MADDDLTKTARPDDETALTLAIEHAPRALPAVIAEYLVRDFRTALGWMDSYAGLESLPVMVRLPVARARAVLELPAPVPEVDRDRSEPQASDDTCGSPAKNARFPRLPEQANTPVDRAALIDWVREDLDRTDERDEEVVDALISRGVVTTGQRATERTVRQCRWYSDDDRQCYESAVDDSDYCTHHTTMRVQVFGTRAARWAKYPDDDDAGQRDGGEQDG